MTNGNALLFGDLGDGGRLSGIERADQKLSTVADHLLGAGAGDIDIRFGIAVDDREFGQAHGFEDRRRDVDAALAVLADTGLEARARQQDTDFQRTTRRAHDRGRGERGGRRGGACKQVAAGWQRPDLRHGFNLPRGFRDAIEHEPATWKPVFGITVLWVKLDQNRGPVH